MIKKLIIYCAFTFSLFALSGQQQLQDVARLDEYPSCELISSILNSLSTNDVKLITRCKSPVAQGEYSEIISQYKITSGQITYSEDLEIPGTFKLKKLSHPAVSRGEWSELCVFAEATLNALSTDKVGFSAVCELVQTENGLFLNLNPSVSITK